MQLAKVLQKKRNGKHRFWEGVLMAVYEVCKRFGWEMGVGEKTAGVMRMFGLTADALGDKSVVHECEVEINEGDVVYITGASGSGKSVLLRELEGCVGESERVNLGDIELGSQQTVVDCFEGDLVGSLRVLNSAGLNDCLCVLNRPCYLSDGQKWRFRLAMALAAGKKFVFADEFCSNLDRVTAAVIAYNVRRFADREGVTFVLAGSHDDILGDLEPDVLVVKELSGPAEVVYKTKVKR